MQVLEAQKRDKIPHETLMAWFNTFRANSWTNEQLEKQVNVLLKSVTYGAVKIDDFFNNVEKFTVEEMELKISNRINSLIQEGNRILSGKEIELEFAPGINITAVKVAIAKRLKIYYNEEISEAQKELANTALLEIAERLGYKKIQFDNLTKIEKVKTRLGF